MTGTALIAPRDVARHRASVNGRVEGVADHYAWPKPLAPAAFHGLPGQFIRAVEPHSEADPSALLVQFLVTCGSAIGPSPHFRVEADRHGLNLFAAIVGATSSARKGISIGRVKALFEIADPVWLREHVASGLSSGEGLIEEVRDERVELVAIKEQGKATGDFEEQVTAPGVDDKRLLVLETELAQPLKLAAREGNILTVVIRQAWDGQTLRTLTKNAPGRATSPHISIVGHITLEELRRHLADVEVANGFANRFLFVCAKRSKVLPEGGSPDPKELGALGEALTRALGMAQGIGEMHRDPDARRLWAEVYEGLTEGQPGLFGSATARGAPQVMRLAMLYAALSGQPQVDRAHLEAGLAVWRYCEQSAAYIFGTALGDPVADEILDALRAAATDGLTRTQIRDLFKRHKTSDQIGRALNILHTNHLAYSEREATAGKPTERWYAQPTKEPPS